MVCFDTAGAEWLEDRHHTVLHPEFSEYIAPLQDAVDLEIATEEERSLLEAWNKYRVLLNRVDTSVALGMKLFVTHVTVTAITISKVQNVY